MRVIKSTMIAVAAALLMCACSGEKDQKKEKGKIEAMAEQTGHEAAKAIKTPIEKADAAADLAAQRAKEINEQIKK